MSISPTNTSTKPLPKVILASTSPRRQELLAMLTVPFTVIPPTVDESDYDHLMSNPKAYVDALAQLKGESIAQHHPEAVVIGSDTTVYLEHPEHGPVTLGKPSSQNDAIAMLSRLQGQEHTVYSAISVSYQRKTHVASLATQVRFAPMTTAEIETYVQTGEPMDKAGSYAIQGLGGMFIEGIDGCYFNVMGMSVTLLRQLFQQHGLSLLAFSQASAKAQHV